MDKNGNFVISLDFELLWGVFDVVNFEERSTYFETTRKVIPRILDQFVKHQVQATWATVGMLFNENWEEWQLNLPVSIPSYKKQELSAYEFGKRVMGKPGTESLCFAPGLIKEISKVEGQEIATHTYSHYYCLEEGQDLDNFQADLNQAITLASKIGVDLKSLVFPRNQLEKKYLKVCYELGIENVRSNPDVWYWHDSRSKAITTKIFRTGDAYVPLGKKYYKMTSLHKTKGVPLEQKASRFLRPVENNRLLRRLKLKRIFQEMEAAAIHHKTYHLWWHPHNFGDRPEESLSDLGEILHHFSELKERYNFQSVNMEQLGKVLSKFNKQ